MRNSPWLLVLLTTLPAILLAGCTPPRGSNSSSDDDDDATEAADWNVEIINETPNTMELIRQRPCPSEDDEDWNEIPMSPAGLAPGESLRTMLPQPACFALAAEGQGCFAEGTTGPMQLDDVVTWTITDDDLLCIG